MSNIGKRAAAAIRMTAATNNTTYTEELVRTGVSRAVLYSWEKNKSDPTGKILQGMAFAGYDIHYILTGVKK